MSAPANQRPLTKEELLQARELFEKDLRILVSSQEQLKDAQERFATNVGSLHILTDAKEEQEVMVPLTSSLSVLGKIQNVNRVMVDIGTGYFVEMNNADATEYYARKVNFLQEQLLQMEKLIVEKKSQMGMIHQALMQMQEQKA